ALAAAGADHGDGRLAGALTHYRRGRRELENAWGEDLDVRRELGSVARGQVGRGGADELARGDGGRRREGEAGGAAVAGGDVEAPGEGAALAVAGRVSLGHAEELQAEGGGREAEQGAADDRAPGAVGRRGQVGEVLPVVAAGVAVAGVVGG